MNVEAVTEAAEFNPVSLLPSWDGLFANLELILRIAVLIGPLCLLGLGLWYLLAPAKEANHLVGFRCWWGMSSVEAWQFTQRVAGLCWTALGLVLTIVMALICNGYRGMAPEVMVISALKALGWELGLVIGSILVINAVVMALFNQKGCRRTRVRR